MKIGRLNHIGVAVPSIDEAANAYREMLGCVSITEPMDMPAQGVRLRFVNLENSQIELIEPLGEASPIASFLSKNPRGGQHHVCFEVQDIYEAKEYMAANGNTVLSEPRIGAHGTLIIFVHPKNFNGVLIELMETPKKGH